MSKTFAVIYRPGEAWLRGKPVSDQPLKDHLEFLMGLRESNELGMGGPFSDSSGGLVLLEVDGIEKAQDIISRDPAILEKILTAKVYEWDRVV